MPAARRADVVRDAFLVALAACGGALDASAYVRTHAFIANMTGNSIVFGLSLGGKHGANATHAAAAIGAFAAGALAGTALGTEATGDDPWPSGVRRPFALEIVLLIAYAACWAHAPAVEPAVLLAIGSAAMGLQSAITHDVHLSGASTTYMTGTIARTAEFFVDSFRFGFRGGVVLNAAAWIVYVAAALVVGTLAASTPSMLAVFGVVIAVVALVAALGRPAVLRARREGG